MKILPPERAYDQLIQIKPEYIPVVELGTTYEGDIIEEYAEMDKCNESALEVLQELSDHVVEVDMQIRACTAIKKGNRKKFSIYNLSGGEKVFLLAHMATKVRKPVILCYNMQVLDWVNKKKFVDRFKSSEYVDIIAPTVAVQKDLDCLLTGYDI